MHTPLYISRRRLLAASGATFAGGASAALAACGGSDDSDSDSESPERQAELLNQVLAAQLAVIEVAAPASQAAPRSIVPSLDRLDEQRRASTQALRDAIADLGGEATDEPAETIGAESQVEGVARRLEASIEATLEAIGEIADAETRQAIHAAVVEDAAALAATRATLGEEIAPDAFVLGGARPGGEEGA